MLIVDDDPSVRHVIRALLRRRGFDTAEAADGAQGLKMIQRYEPHVVLLDMLMPEKDGIETLREIRSMDPLMPVIAMSGGSRIDAEICLRFASALGAPLVLLKPFTADELETNIDLALKRRDDEVRADRPDLGCSA